MALNNKIERIVKNLLGQTEAGKVIWDSTIDDGFITSREDSSIVIERLRERRTAWILRFGLREANPSITEEEYERLPEKPYRITLSDSKGNKVASFVDEELPDPMALANLYAVVSQTRAEKLADAWLQ